MVDIDDDDADVMTDDDEMTTANVKGSVIHVRVAHDRQMPGVVWEKFHNKDQQVKYWNLAVQSKGEGKGAWTMAQCKGGMSEDVVHELKLCYRTKSLAGLLPACCATMMGADDLFNCTVRELKVRCYALMGQDRDGKPLTSEESADIGKLMMTKTWEIAPDLHIMESFTRTHVAMITMHPSLDESQIDGDAIESSPTFAANTAHGLKLWELIIRDHKKASRNLSEGRRQQRQCFLDSIRHHCRDALHEKARAAGRAKAFVGLYADVYLLISSRYAKLRNDELERESTGMANLQVTDWSRTGRDRKRRDVSRSNSPPYRKKADRERSRSRERDRGNHGKKKHSGANNERQVDTSVPSMSQSDIDDEVSRLDKREAGTCYRCGSTCPNGLCAMHTTAGNHPDHNRTSAYTDTRVSWADHVRSANLVNSPLIMGRHGGVAAEKYIVTQAQLTGYKKAIRAQRRQPASSYEPPRGRREESDRPPFRGTREAPYKERPQQQPDYSGRDRRSDTGGGHPFRDHHVDL